MLKFMKKVIVFAFLIVGIVFSYLYFRSSDVFLTVIGPMDMADGIGRQSFELIKALENDFKINYKPTVNSKKVPKNIKIINKWSRDVGKVILFEDVLAFCSTKHLDAWLTNKRKKSICIAYTMLESTRIPEPMVYNLNTYFDAAVVPDPFLVEAYEASGVKIPVFYVPLGLYLDNFLNEPLKDKKNTPFVFANLSSCINRKNTLALIRAFYQAFKDNPDVILKINFRTGEEPYIHDVINEIGKLECDRIMVTRNCLTSDDYLKFYKHIDCYINLAKGEGFSIQPREAMILGIPVIVSDNTGQSTIVASNLVRSVKSQITEPAYYIFSNFQNKPPHGLKYGKLVECTSFISGTYGCNYGCKIEDAIIAMKDVYENYEKYLAKKEKARAWASQYQYTKLTPLYKNIVLPKKVILGKDNKITKEYLMTSSFSLYKKYCRLLESVK